MRKIMFLVLTVAAALLAGCRTETTITGQKCYGISDSDKERLTAMAKKTLQKKNSVVNAGEYALYIKNAEPEVKTVYTGDCFGTASLKWQLPGKTITIKFEGDLTQENIIMTAISAPVYDENAVIYQNVPGRKNSIQPLNRRKK